jgi:hypothetical protein
MLPGSMAMGQTTIGEATGDGAERNGAVQADSDGVLDLGTGGGTGRDGCTRPAESLGGGSIQRVGTEERMIFKTRDGGIFPFFLSPTPAVSQKCLPLSTPESPVPSVLTL